MSDERNHKMTRAEFVAELSDIWMHARDDMEFDAGIREMLDESLTLLRLTWSTDELIDLEAVCHSTPSAT